MVLAEAMNRQEDALSLTMKDIVEWVRSSIQGRLYDTDLELRKAMKEVGAIWYEERINIGGRLQLTAMNSRAFESLKQKHGLKVVKNVASLSQIEETVESSMKRRSDFIEDLRKIAKKPNDITNSSM